MENDKEINIVSEAIRSWIVKIIILSLNVVVIFLLFPFIKTVSIIVILFLSIALYCGINTFVNKKTRIIKLRWLSLSSFSNESQNEQLSQLETIQLIPNRKWWSDEYLDWVMYNTFKLILAIPKSEKQK